MILPKAELHLHLEGTLEPETIFRLAERNCIPLPYRDVEDLASRYQFDDLQTFLNLYYANMTTLLHAPDFADMTEAYLIRAAADGVRHAEVFFDPQAHTARGVPLQAALEGVCAALAAAPARHGISTGLIITMLRDHSAASAMQTLEDVLRLGVPFMGIGLDSAELGHPPSKFQKVFERARSEGLHTVAHAGEEGPPSYIWEALQILGAERIDHGVRCLEDPTLLITLAQQRIPLTVCPLSNVHLKVVPEISQHPLRAMLGAGLMVTINSDDPAYFGGYIEENYRAVAQALDLDAATMADLARNSVNASFLEPAGKRHLLLEIDATAGLTR